MRYTLLFLLAFSRLQLALASLYPTHPTADTMFDAGTQVPITWIDTNHRPRFTEVGSMEMELRTTEDRYVATLGKAISPMSFTHSVRIPDNIIVEGPYVILFIWIHPPMTIWSADFGIAPIITDSALPYIPQLEDTNATHPRITLVLPTATIVSELAPTQKYAAATTITASSLPAGDGGGAGLNRVHSSTGSANPKGSSFQTAKFRLVFIVWPALFGMSMAM
ncbi:hypothetical protein DFH09DRAFT_903195 [Mycena vulgaris]|nr:hypothetical protein DFH09DRAFT_903195 [Mycena vulgaris]